MIGMLVTFTALVLGLLTASVKTAFDRAGRDLQDYALELTQLDQCLRNYGPGTEATLGCFDPRRTTGMVQKSRLPHVRIRA